MNSLREKSWNNEEVTPRKKLLSRLLTHKLSRQLDHAHFDVVFESSLGKFDKQGDQPDVLILRANDELKPVAAIELTNQRDFTEMSIACKVLLESTVLEEFFIYEYENHEWYYLRKGMDWFMSGSVSLALGINISGISEPFYKP